MALYYADEALVVTNPEVSSVRDSDRIWAFWPAKSAAPSATKSRSGRHLLITVMPRARVDKGEMLSVENICDILCIPLIGVVPGIPGGAAGLQ